MSEHKNINEFVSALVSDELFTNAEKIEMLNCYKGTIAKKMENRLMDKAMAEKYFNMLGVLQEGINGIS